MSIATARNIVFSLGAYTLGRIVSIVVALLLGHRLDAWLDPEGVATSLVRTFDTSLPEALGAAASGIAVALLIDARRPERWIWLTAAGWLLLYLGDATRPTALWFDILPQVVTATLPAVTCLLGFRLALSHRPRIEGSPPSAD
jgi:hypothetical protein